MKDIRIVHDQCGAYSDWLFDCVTNDNELRRSLHLHNYVEGKLPPNYPMPVIMDSYSNPCVWDCVLGYYDCFG